MRGTRWMLRRGAAAESAISLRVGASSTSIPLPPGAWRGAALSVSCGHSPHADFAKGEEIHPREAICLWKMERSREKRLETALI